MMIYLGSDHGGFELKEKLKEWLAEWGYRYEDCGPDEYDGADDYPDFAKKVASHVQTSTEGLSRAKPLTASEGLALGIVICRNGVGVCIVANKFKGIRCALGFSTKQIGFARLDDDANVLALPADYLTNDTAKSIVRTFLTTEFSEADRHVRRLNKIRNLEEKIQDPKSKTQNSK